MLFSLAVRIYKQKVDWKLWIQVSILLSLGFTLRSSDWAISLSHPWHQYLCVSSFSLHVFLPGGSQCILPGGYWPGCQHSGGSVGEEVCKSDLQCVNFHLPPSFPQNILTLNLFWYLLFCSLWENKQPQSNFGGGREPVKRLWRWWRPYWNSNLNR